MNKPDHRLEAANFNSVFSDYLLQSLTTIFDSHMAINRLICFPTIGYTSPATYMIRK